MPVVAGYFVPSFKDENKKTKRAVLGRKTKKAERKQWRKETVPTRLEAYVKSHPKMGEDEALNAFLAEEGKNKARPFTIDKVKGKEGIIAKLMKDVKKIVSNLINLSVLTPEEKKLYKKSVIGEIKLILEKRLKESAEKGKKGRATRNKNYLSKLGKLKSAELQKEAEKWVKRNQENIQL